MNTREFIESICKDLKEGESPDLILATLTLDGQPPSIGQFALESEKCGQGSFQPTDESILHNCQSTQGTLKLSGKNETLKVTNCCRCGTWRSHHFHLQFEVINQTGTQR